MTYLLWIQGFSGLDGAKGDGGNPGEQGIPGPRGTQGLRGPPGKRVSNKIIILYRFESFAFVPNGALVLTSTNVPFRSALTNSLHYS